MISPATCVTMIMFAGSGLYLYQAKHHAEVETREIRRLLAEADATRQRAAVLITDYQLENDPERLGELTARFQHQLKPTQPTQFTTAADLERRLPPIGLPAPTPTPTETDLVYAYPPAPALVAGPPVPLSLDPAHPVVTAGRSSASGAEIAVKSKPPARIAAPVGARDPAVAMPDPSQYASSGRSVSSTPVSSRPVSPTPVYSASTYATPAYAAPAYQAPVYSAPVSPALISPAQVAARASQPQYSPVVATSPAYPFGAQTPAPYSGSAQSSGSSLGMARGMTPTPYVQTVTPPLAPGGSGG